MAKIPNKYLLMIMTLILCIANSRGEDESESLSTKPVIHPKDKALLHLQNATCPLLYADRAYTTCLTSPCLPVRIDICKLRDYEKTALCFEIQRLRTGIECGEISILYPKNYYTDRKEVTRCKSKLISDNQRRKDMLLCPGVKCYERPTNGFESEETSKNAVFFWAANGDVKNSVLIFTEIDHDTVELFGYVSDIEFIRE